MKIQFLFLFILTSYTANIHAAASNTELYAIDFLGIKKDSPVHYFINNPKNFEAQLGNEKDELTYKQRKLRFDFLKQLKTDSPGNRVNALTLACGNSLPVATSLIVRSGVGLDIPIKLHGIHALSPLCIAASQSPLPFMKKLLALGADANYLASAGEAPLLYAVHAGCIAKVQHLLTCGADPNIARPDGRTPLITAAHRPDSEEILRPLMAHGADVTAQDSEGNTALLIASSKNCIENTRALLDARRHLCQLPAIIHTLTLANKRGEWPLYAAASMGNGEIFKMLHNAGSSLLGMIRNPHGQHSILTALACSECPDLTDVLASCEELSVEDCFILSRAQPNGNYPIHSSVARKKPDVLKFLLERCVDIFALNAEGKTAYALAVETGNERAEELLRSAVGISFLDSPYFVYR